jgi:RNA polymerase sigma-70 factor (ECF subfamily)
MATTTAAQQIMSNSPTSPTSDSAGDWRSSVPEKYWDVIDRYREELTLQALGILKSRHDAEDVVQETFAEAFRNVERLSKAESIGAWLKMANHRNALNRLRGGKRAAKKVSARQQQALEPGFTTGGFSRVELRESISHAMQALPAELKEIVELRFWQQLSYDEIGARLKLSPDAVQRRLIAASNQLYARLKPQIGTGAHKPQSGADPNQK